MDLRGWSNIDQKRAGVNGYKAEVTLNRRTAELGRAAGRIFEREGIFRIKDITVEMARAEIKALNLSGYSSGTISGYSKALSDAHQIVHGTPVDFGSLVPSRSSDAPTDGRAYLQPHIKEIIANQPPVYGLMTEVVYEGALRVSEINNLRPAAEFPAQISEQRLSQLVDYRFSGREGVYYTVTGKGGLDRTIILGEELSERLEAFRLDETRMIKSERGEDGRSFEQHYDFPSGEEWAKNFSVTSKDLFSWSRGAHGLRHSRVQELVKSFQEQGFTWDQSRLAVSQEIGHFRVSEINTYLR
ncbi:hypothetical protein MMIC_P0005 [Mariprofundus micogutta]|uniref:Phage integrase family protein n=2 Tax=Mariprofundus micogutta TaxID=1921010 RepID=A0A1L8CJI0_9PROT|nr:hypothetical protein MMIC_P0005 [Mariprofundus micogutta]